MSTVDEVLSQVQTVLDELDDDGTRLWIELTPGSICVVRAESGQTGEENMWIPEGTLGESIQQALAWLLSSAEAERGE